MRMLRLLVCLGLLLIGLAPTMEARAEENEVEKVAEALVSNEPSSEAWKKASETLKKMSEEDQGKVGQSMVQKTTADAEKQVKWLTTLNTLGATAGKDAVGKSLGKVVSKMFGGLAKLVRDPTLGGGEEKLAEELIKGGLDVEEAYEVAGKVRTAVQAKRNAAEAQKKAPKAQGGGNSVEFSGLPGHGLSFAGDLFSSVSIPPGPPTTDDAIVGAQLVLPSFALSSYEDGAYVFTPVGSDAMSIRAGATALLTGTVPLLSFRDNQFFMILMDLALADAALDSFFHDDLLAPTASNYAAAVDTVMMGKPYGSVFTISITPTADFLALTQNWTQSGRSAVAMEAGPVGYGVAEPPSLALVLTAAMLMFGAASRGRGLRAGAWVPPAAERPRSAGHTPAEPTTT